MQMTITDVRNDLLNVFAGLRDGTMEAQDAVEINNTAGKIISSAKVQLAYHALRSERPEIPFLDSDPTTKTLEHNQQAAIAA